MNAMKLPLLRVSPLADALLNGTLFNISWFAIVLTQSSLYGPLQVIAHLCIHFCLIGRGLAELKLVALLALAGALLDQVLFLAGLFTVAGTPAPAPLWLSCLWPVFATTLTHVFAGFAGRPVLAVLLGAIGGGGSYVAGVRLTDVEFASALWGPVLVAALWAVLFPLLLLLARKLVPGREHG